MSRPYDGSNADYTDQDDTSWPGGSHGEATATGTPRRRPPPVSGVQKVVTASGVTARPASGQQIVRWLSEEEDASPLVVHVSVGGGINAANPFAQQLQLIAGGDGGGDTTRSAGVLRLTYGSGNVLRVADMDLRSASYQLPPCSSCTVEAFGYQTGPISVNVAASIVPGVTDSPSRAFNTMYIASLAAAATKSVNVPYLARWVSMLAPDVTAIGAGQPSLLLTQATFGPAILQDYTAGTFLGAPGQMVELASRGTISVKNNGAASANVTLRFGLEL